MKRMQAGYKIEKYRSKKTGLLHYLAVPVIVIYSYLLIKKDSQRKYVRLSDWWRVSGTHW